MGWDEMRWDDIYTRTDVNEWCIIIVHHISPLPSMPSIHTIHTPLPSRHKLTIPTSPSPFSPPSPKKTRKKLARLDGWTPFSFLTSLRLGLPPAQGDWMGWDGMDGRKSEVKWIRMGGFRSYEEGEEEEDIVWALCWLARSLFLKGLFVFVWTFFSFFGGLFIHFLIFSFQGWTNGGKSEEKDISRGVSSAHPKTLKKTQIPLLSLKRDATINKLPPPSTPPNPSTPVQPSNNPSKPP